MDVRDRIVREPERREITATSAATAWRGEKAGTFPRRIRLGANSVGWRLSELMAWMESRQPATSVNAKPVAPGGKRGRKPRHAGTEVLR